MPEAKPHLKYLSRTRKDRKSRKGYLRLDMNEGIPGLPQDFVSRVLSGIDSELLASYPEYKTLREKIASHNNLNPENIALSNGSDAAIKYIFDTYVSAADKILLTDPTFAMYPVYCAMFNSESIVVEYKPDLSFPSEEFIEKISSDVKIAVIVNPNNPTGTALRQQELIRIIKKAVDKDVLIVVDEAYFYFYPESIIAEVKNYKNLIVLRTFSKLCSMAAVRLGYAAACPEIIKNLRKVKPSYDVNGLAVLFAQRLLSKPDIIQSLIQSVSEGKKYLTQKLTEEAIEYKDGCANFVLIKCKDRIKEIENSLADKRILVHPGFTQDFLKDYLRVSVGNRTVMERFWVSFIKIWKNKHD